MSKKHETTHEENNLQIHPISQSLILEYSQRTPYFKERIVKHFADSGSLFTFQDPPEIDTIKMSASLVSDTATHEIYLFLFGAREEILMTSFTFFKRFDPAEIPLIRTGWDVLEGNKHEIYIMRYGFASEERAAQVTFKCDVELIELK